MLSSKLEEELREWVRPQSPLTTFAKSLRMEEPTGGQTSQGAPPSESSATTQQAEKLVDHFADIDIDELPDNIRTAVVNAKQHLGTQQTQLKEAQTKQQQADAFARQKQSEADRLRAVVQRHNLDPNGQPFSPPNLEDAKFQARVARLTKQGLKPEAAEIYAKMLAEEAAEQKKELLQEFAPLAAGIGNLQASEALHTVESKNPDLFKIPEIAKSVRENVQVLVNQGNAVSEHTVKHLLTMAYGEHVMTHPPGAKTTIPDAIPSLGGGGGMTTGGGHTNITNKTGGGPVATQPETLQIIAALNQHMRVGLPSASKSKK